MGSVTYTEPRANLARCMDEAVEGRKPLVVTRQGGRGNVVMVSEEEFEGWRETGHLLRTPPQRRAPPSLDPLRRRGRGARARPCRGRDAA